jgi:hypothetical protein
MDPGLRQDDDLAAVPVGLLVIPAQAGIQFDFRSGWILACHDDGLATVLVALLVIPARAGMQFDFRPGLIPACATMTGSQRCWFSFASFASFALRL